MMIIECSQAKLLYVSDTIEEVLDEEPKNWIGSCLYDLLHPKVRGQSTHWQANTCLLVQAWSG